MQRFYKEASFIYANTCKRGLNLVQFYSVELLNFHSHLLNVLEKIFAAPLFTFNVLLLFNFQRFIFFLYRNLVSIDDTNVILLQTQQSDVF